MPDKTPLQLAKEALDSVIAQKKLNQELIKSLGPAIIDTLKPILNEIASNSKIPKEEILNAISKIRLPDINVPEPNITLNVPEQIPPKIVVPKPEVTVNVPPIKIPDIKWPDGDIPIKGWVQLMGVNLNNPLPVQLRDANGKPVNLLENLTTIVGGSGGGGFKVNKISDIANSAWANLLNSDGRLRMSAESGVAGLTDTELRASSVPVAQASGAVWSVNVAQQDISQLVHQVSGAAWSVSVNDAFRTTVASSLINSDDRLRVSVETGSSGLTDAELRATSVPVAQVSGANWTVNITDVFATTIASNVVNPDNRVKVELTGTQPVSSTDLDIRDLVDATDSIRAYQLSGANWSVSVTENKAEDAAHASGDTGFMALSVRNSTNTTFAADGDYQPIATDGIGRAIVRPVQTRGLLQTAYVSIANGTETTLLAGATGIYFDLIYAMATNNSDAAVTVDFRAATAGGVQTSIRVPANGTAGVSLTTPIPQDVAADTWTVDMPDITGTTVTVGALFSKEV